MIGVPGGFQPRAAVGYMLVVALEVAALAGVGEGLRTEIDVAAAAAKRLAVGLGAGVARGLAGEVAGALAARNDPARSSARG